MKLRPLQPGNAACDNPLHFLFPLTCGLAPRRYLICPGTIVRRGCPSKTQKITSKFVKLIQPLQYHTLVFHMYLLGGGFHIFSWISVEYGHLAINSIASNHSQSLFALFLSCNITTSISFQYKSRLVEC